MKYTACDAKLEVRCGCLAVMRDCGATAADIAKAAHQAIQRFCRRRVLHPAMNCHKPQRHGARTSPADSAARVANHITRHVEMFTADGAANEQLAGKMLHPGSLRSGLVPKLPGLKLLLRDKAHGTRRLTERTVEVDPVLRHIMETLVAGQESLARVLQNSRQIAKIFQQHIAKQQRLGSAAALATAAQNLSFAKQRFDSTASPLAKLWFNLEAAMGTCAALWDQRDHNSKEARMAKAVLTLMADERNLLLAGMLSDAADECLFLTRFFDREAFQLEETSAQIAQFKHRLDWLFMQRGCLQTGFTALALQHLRKARLIPVPGRSEPVALGGREPAPAIVTEALGRMVAWSRVAYAVLDTEFPDFEIVACYDAFRLVTPTATTGALSPAAAQPAARQLRRLAEVFGVDPDGLVAQFANHHRLAEQRFAKGEPAATAWRNTVADTQRTSRRRREFPAADLIAVLARFLVAPGSTAGIEQNFSKMKRCLGEHWCGTELAEERKVVLALAAQTAPKPSQSLLEAARVVWAQNFSMPRRSAGSKKLPARVKKRTAVRTATQWLRSRRLQVGKRAAAAAARPNPNPGAGEVEAAADSAWTESHAQEVRFQKAARAERERAAVQEGILAAPRLGPNAAAHMAEYRMKEADRQAQHVARHKRLAVVTEPPTPPTLRGRKVYIHEGARPALSGAGCAYSARTAELWETLRREQQLQVVEDRALASLFVVPAVSELGDRAGLVAAMVGGVVVTPEALLTPGGSILQFRRALDWPRHVFISRKCQEKHAVMVNLARRVSGLSTNSRWTYYFEADGPQRKDLFRDRAIRRGHAHRSEVATVLLEAELGTPDFSQLPNQMLLSSFISGMRRVDRRATVLGICGR
jgi:hypothetical protein